MFLLFFIVLFSFFFFFNVSAPPEIYTLSLHDALPISFNVTSTRGLVPVRGSPFPTDSGAGPEGFYDGGKFLYVALRSEEHTSELQSLRHVVCRLLLEKKKNKKNENKVKTQINSPRRYQ